MVNVCKSCKFFQGNALGVCMRYPEQIGKSETSWCGEFVAIKQQPEILELPVVEMSKEPKLPAISAEQIEQIMEKAAPIIEQKRRGRPKKGENDV